MSDDLLEALSNPDSKLTAKLSPEMLASAVRGIEKMLAEETAGLGGPAIYMENGYHVSLKSVSNTFDLREMNEINRLLEAQSVMVDVKEKKVTYFHVPAKILATFVDWT